jgi:SH3-like domain-containing protein
MKKSLPKLIGLGLSCLLFCTSVHAADYLTVTAENANVRTGPGVNYPTSMELFQGYPLKVISKEGEWYKVSDFEDDGGWVHQGIVKKCDTVIVISDKSINMRAEDLATSRVVADVERGVVLTKLATKGKWTQVRHSGGTTGWIYSPLLWP